MSGAGRWRTIEHTGDVAIAVEAASLEGLFATAAAALTGVLLGEEAGELEAGRGGQGPAREVRIEAPELEVLLVDWLRELLYIQMSEGAVVSGSEIRELSEGSLVADVTLQPLARERNIERELKAVTYHDVEVNREDGGWVARVVFDI